MSIEIETTTYPRKLIEVTFDTPDAINLVKSIFPNRNIFFTGSPTLLTHKPEYVLEVTTWNDVVTTSWNDIDFDETKGHVNDLKHYIQNSLGEFFHKLDIPEDEDFYLHKIIFLCSFEIPAVSIRGNFPRHKDDNSNLICEKYRNKLNKK